jgi:hypothetical protein
MFSSIVDLSVSTISVTQLQHKEKEVKINKKFE